jgi:hypothetical protein
MPVLSVMFCRDSLIGGQWTKGVEVISIEEIWPEGGLAIVKAGPEGAFAYAVLSDLARRLFRKGA